MANEINSEPEFPNVPDFKDLPAVAGMPQGCAWGIFDKPNQKDTLGTLNFLTPSIVRSAYRELQHGISVSLNLPLDAVPLGFRAEPTHTPLHWTHDLNQTITSWDDTVSFNTQASSQWDSLLHFAHQTSGKFYNGSDPSKVDLSQASSEYAKTGVEIPTLDHWHQKGGLVARGVLLDFEAWMAKQGKDFNALRRYAITVEELEKVAEWQGVDLRTGDVLIVRTGFVEKMNELGSAEEMQKAMATSAGFAGVQGNSRTAEWFWNRRLAGVASDNIAFEAFPPEHEDGSIAGVNDLVLHPYFLSLFGLHIGELWALKELSEVCRRLKKYSFLLTSVPLNLPGLVGSPPNALALF